MVRARRAAALAAVVAVAVGWVAPAGRGCRGPRPLRVEGIPAEPLRVRRGFRHKQKSPRAKPQASPNLKPSLTARLHVVAGSARGRRLESPQTMLRPMMGKVRESLFSTLFSLGVFDAPRKVSVLDAFCGSGAVGIEALSRGAAFCGFVDLSQSACDVAMRNAAACGFPDTAEAACCTAQAALRGEAFGGRKFDLVTLTPPYDEVSYRELCDGLANSPILEEDAVVVVEYPVELGSLPPRLGELGQLVGLRNRRHGRTVLALYAYRPSGKLNFDFRLDEFQAGKRKK